MFNALYSPCLLQNTNHLFKYDKKVTIFLKKVIKNVGTHRFYQTCLIIGDGELVVKISKRSADFKNKIAGV